jgi:hypothetical protein
MMDRDVCIVTDRYAAVGSEDEIMNSADDNNNVKETGFKR